MKGLERDHFGMEFALALHYGESHLTLAKILSVTQAACKKYNRETDSYLAKILLPHRYLKGVGVKVPRLAPPASKLVPVIRSVEEKLGVEPAENGRLALRSATVAFQEAVARTMG